MIVKHHRFESEFTPNTINSLPCALKIKKITCAEPLDINLEEKKKNFNLSATHSKPFLIIYLKLKKYNQRAAIRTSHYLILLV